MNRRIQIGLAGLSVEMISNEMKVKDFCIDFIENCSKAPDISVCADNREIDAEMARNPGISRWYCEGLCLFRAVAERFPAFDRFVFHGGAVGIDNKAYIFAGPSGIGKSTHISLWKECFGDKVTVINGDKPIIGLNEGRLWVYSSPWAGKEDWKSNVAVPLEGICFVKRGEINRISPVSPSEMFEEIIMQTYVPASGEMLQKTLNLLEKLADTVPFYVMECNISTEAAIMSFDAMYK